MTYIFERKKYLSFFLMENNIFKLKNKAQYFI